MIRLATPLVCAALAVSAAFSAAGRADACATPVFQYALENWETDPYQVSVIHNADFTEEQQKAVDLLRSAAQPEGAVANVSVEVVNQDGAEGGAPLPRIEVRYPRTIPAPNPLWKGELTLDNARAVLDSPVRKEIGKLLLERKSAVWLLLESGDRRKDREAAQTLERMAARLEKTLQLPDPDAWGVPAEEIASEISFRMLRLRRNDSAERVFVPMLLGIERDLAGFGEVPMVFPMYGRGRALYALVDRGINEWTLTQAGEFLVGPCSCVIKTNNPGVDMLLSVDWQKHVKPLAPDAAAAPGGLGTFLERAAEAERRLGDEGEGKE